MPPGKTIFTYVYIEKKIFSRTSRPISIKLGTNHPLVKGILNCSNKGPGPLQRGDNHKNAKRGWGHLPLPTPGDHDVNNSESTLGHFFVFLCFASLCG
jgi:hypothetical protein